MKPAAATTKAALFNSSLRKIRQSLSGKTCLIHCPSKIDPIKEPLGFSHSHLSYIYNTIDKNVLSALLIFKKPKKKKPNPPPTKKRQKKKTKKKTV